MGDNESECCVFTRDCIKAIIAAVLVTKLHRSLKHIITPALKNGKYTNGMIKGRNTLIACFFFIIVKKGRLIWGLQKNIKSMPLYNQIK